MAKTANIEMTMNPTVVKSLVNDAAVIVISSVIAEVERRMKSVHNESEYESLNSLNKWLKLKMEGI